MYVSKRDFEALSEAIDIVSNRCDIIEDEKIQNELELIVSSLLHLSRKMTNQILKKSKEKSN